MANINELGDLKSVKGLKIVHLNVRSVVKKIDQLRMLMFDSGIDVFILSETWLGAHLHSKIIEINGFDAHRLDRIVPRKSGKKKSIKGGGLLTYINTKHLSSCEMLTDMSISNENIEAQWSLVHRTHCKNVLICNLYMPASGDVQKATKYLDNCLKAVNLEKTDIFILGDMNINFKSRSTPNYKRVNFFAQSNGLTQFIKNTTRNTDKSKSLLDIAFSNSKFVSLSGTLNHFISDHQPLFLVHKKNRDKRKSVEFRGRSYRDFDNDGFRKELFKNDWDDFYELSDPGLAWEYVLDKITGVLDKMCPLRTLHIKNYRPVWMTGETIQQIKDKDYFYKKAKSRGEADDWNIAKFLRNVTNSNIRSAKREFVLDQLKKYDSDAKKFWNTVREVIPSDKGNNKQDILLKDNGSKIDRQEVAHYINQAYHEL